MGRMRRRPVLGVGRASRVSGSIVRFHAGVEPEGDGRPRLLCREKISEGSNRHLVAPWQAARFVAFSSLRDAFGSNLCVPQDLRSARTFISEGRVRHIEMERVVRVE